MSEIKWKQCANEFVHFLKIFSSISKNLWKLECTQTFLKKFTVV